MTDEHYDDHLRPGVYDDDRLLACALGLDEDPELLAAAAADAGLAARLETMRADVERIGAQVSAAVPEPDESYTDLSGERWGGLKEFFEAPAAAAPRRKRRWWQVVAPVAAVLVVALLVGIVAVNGGLPGGSSGSTSGSSEVARSADDAGGAQSFEGSSTKSDATAPEVTSSSGTLMDRFRDQLNRFAVVVLARARKATGAVQRFAVLRIFKGSAPKVVELVVNDQPTDAGRLHVLMLDPTAPPEAEPTVAATSESPWPLAGSPSPDAESPLPATISPEPAAPLPSPIPSLAALEVPGDQLPVSYLYQGEPTVEWELDPGTDPQDVTITLP